MPIHPISLASTTDITSISVAAGDVDADDTLFGVEDGTAVQFTGQQVVDRHAEHSILADTGAANITNESAETSFLDSTVDIPAGTLAAGDVIKFHAHGSIVNNTGSGKTFQFKVKLEGSIAINITTDSIADGHWGFWTLDGDGRVDSTGATGTMPFNAILTIGGETAGLPNTDVLSQHIHATGLSTYDTTEALTLDMTVQMSAADSDLTTACGSAWASITPTPV